MGNMTKLAEELIGAVARGWCTGENAGKVMDVELAAAIAHEVAPLADDTAMFRWLATYPNFYTVCDLLRADQYATLRRACESLMPVDSEIAKDSAPNYLIYGE